MTSHGSLTIDCLPENGVGATETKACHQFSCTPTGMLRCPSAHPSLPELVELVDMHYTLSCSIGWRKYYGLKQIDLAKFYSVIMIKLYSY